MSNKTKNDTIKIKTILQEIRFEIQFLADEELNFQLVILNLYIFNYALFIFRNFKIAINFFFSKVENNISVKSIFFFFNLFFLISLQFFITIN